MFSSQRCCQTLMSADEACRFGILTASDRATAGEYEDRSGPAIKQFLEDALTSPWEVSRRLVEDDRSLSSRLSSSCVKRDVQSSSPPVELDQPREMLRQRQPKRFARGCFRASVNKCERFHSNTFLRLCLLDKLLAYVVRL